MTAQLRAEREKASSRAPAPAPSRTAKFRAATRLAQRQVRRTWVSSLLIVALVALPIAGMSGVAVYVDSLTSTPAEQARVELGEMAAWVQPAGVPDEGFWQMPSEPQWNGYPQNADGSMEEPEGEIPADPLAALPDGTETVKISWGEVQIDTATGVARVEAWGGPVVDPRFSGRFDLLDGRAPANEGEVLVSPATLSRAAVSLGGTLTLRDPAETVTVVGTVTAAALQRDDPAVFFFDTDRLDSEVRWYLPDRALSWPDVQDLNAAGVIAYSRELVLDPPIVAASEFMEEYDPSASRLAAMWSMVLLLGAAGLAAAYMVVMLAGAAFAVSARRQQRSLAIAASVGAASRDLRRVVRLQGTVLGLVGGIVGVALGIGAAALAIALTDPGSATYFWGFHVPWWGLAGILVFAVLVGTASALMPARGVARTDALSALRGARRPQKVRASRPVVGSVLLIVGVVVTIVSGIGAGAMGGNRTLFYDVDLLWVPVVGIVIGPIIAQLGFVLSGRWLLWLSSLLLSRFGVAARIASRDAVANGSRTVPAFAAIGATVFAGIFALGMGTMITGQTARSWVYQAPIGTAVGYSFSYDPGPLTAEAAADASESIGDVLREVDASAITVVERQPAYWVDEADIPADEQRAVVVTPADATADQYAGYNYSELNDPQNNISVIPVDGVSTATGVTLTAEQRRAYADGAALVTDADLVVDGQVVVAAWSQRDWTLGMEVPDNIFTSWPTAPDAKEPLWSQEIDAIAVSAPHQQIAVAIAPATADRLGLDVRPLYVFGAFDDPVTTAQQDRLQELSEGLDTGEVMSSLWIETGPSNTNPWLVPLLVAVAVLVIGSSAVALGLARFERRPDDATLSAVGGTNRLRRRIGFWQALLIAGFGTLSGAVAGILPPIGFWIQSQSDIGRELSLADMPWVLIVVLVVALPVVIAAANALIPPRRPDLTRRTAIA